MPQPTRRGGWSTRLASVITGAVLLLALTAVPASAANLTATNARSVVTAIDPATDAVRAEVVGGDAAIRVVAAPGHEVIITGYDGEPYLRIAADGSVSVNTASPALLLNRTRTGATDTAPSSTDAGTTWVAADGDGEVTWHDHRIHAMSSADQEHDWTIGILVDGQPTSVVGRLRVVAGPSPMPWIAVILSFAVALVLLGRRRAPSMSALAAVTVGGLGLLEAVAVHRQTPSVLHPDLLPVLLAAGALVLGLAALRTRGGIHRLCTAGSLALGAGVFAPMLAALSHAAVPGAGPGALTRLVVSMASGLILGGAALLVIGAGRTEPIRRPGADAAHG